MAIQVRRGNEADFDPSKMLPGEWAVSLDTKYVRMCFAPGVCVRMATYEAFEEDMVKIEAILKEAQTIEEAVSKIYEEVKQAVIDVEIAKESATTATEKAEEAKAYANSANESAQSAETASISAQQSAEVSAQNAETSVESADSAKNSETNAATNANLAVQKAGEASTSAQNASDSEESARMYSENSQSYAVGGTGTREGEDIDNSKYYYEQAKHISQGGNGLVPLGTIAFENLPTEDIMANGMYNISNDFVSDERFVDGGGISYGKGSNVYYTATGYWDVLAASSVTGVKGASESAYRQGMVNITAANIGLGKVNNTSDAEKPISTATQAALDLLAEDIEETKKSVSDGKATVASAITGQGVSTASDATFATMASNINTVATNKYNGGYNAGVSATKKGTATQAQVLDGVTFTSQNGVNLKGTMPNQGAVNKTITPSDSQQIYTIPAGYHNGNGKVTVGAAKSSGMTIKSLQNNRPAGAVTNNQTETNVVFDVSDFDSLTIQSLAAAVYSTSLSYVSFTVDGTEVKRISDTSASNIVISLAGASTLKISMVLVAQAANVHNYQTLTNLVFE